MKRETKRRVACLLLLVLVLIAGVQFLLVGCVCIPKEPLDAAIQEEELAEHVRFLAQPRLRGRKPVSMGSWHARRYIKERFRAYGLVPWGEAAGYEQPIVVGTNVVGVLPGWDAELADQIVLVSAHYDHLGKGYLGAADNASGVAAMLEIAERLSQREERPRRSVCFAAFDREETGLFGSFAFTCREDFSPSKIAATINVDMLGRRFLDVLDSTLFVIGTESYPALREQILRSAETCRIQMIPLGTDVVPTRGDHAPFEPVPTPSLFFSCGEFSDYHKKSDTRDKLDYDELKRSTEVISDTIEILCKADGIQQRVVPTEGDRGELSAVKSVIRRLLDEEESLDLTDGQREAGGSLLERVESMLAAKDYSLEDRKMLMWDATRVVKPVRDSLLADSDAEGSDEKAAGRGITERDVFNWKHRARLLEGYKSFVEKVLEQNRVKLFVQGMPEYKYDIYDLADDEIRFVREEDDRGVLSVMLPIVRTSIDIGGFPGNDLDYYWGTRVEFHDCRGSIEEVVDYCLLLWREKVPRNGPDRRATRKTLRPISKRKSTLVGLEADESYDESWRKVLKKVTGEERGKRFDDWLQWRLPQGGFSSEQEWLDALVHGANPVLVVQSLQGTLLQTQGPPVHIVGGPGLSNEQLEKLAQCDGSDEAVRTILMTGAEPYERVKRDDRPRILAGIFGNREVRPDVRADAIRTPGWGGRGKLKGALLNLVDILDDETVCDERFLHSTLEEFFLFHDHPKVQSERRSWERYFEREGRSPRTISDVALENLKRRTQQDFEKDAEAWGKWIEENASDELERPANEHESKAGSPE
jgi:hypothetical protein